jgi:hypothetical protein
MPDKPNTPNFTSTELSAIDHLITHLQAQGVGQNDPVPLTTPVAAVVASAVLSTAAVLCIKVPDDNAKLQQIADLGSQLKGSTTLANLIALRSRAVQSIAESSK